jgi:SWI/SNF-related matrix-associated actin-dependent regulator of chromatin subfamily A-like protein 1
MKRIVLISGTPVLSRPSELFNLVKILRPDIFTSFRIFGELYCNPQQKKIFRRGGKPLMVKEYKGCTNSKKLNYWLSKYLMIRRLKKDVLTELPPKRRIKMTVEVSAKHKKELQQLMIESEKFKEKMNELEGRNVNFNELVSNIRNKTLENSKDNEATENPWVQLYKLTGLCKVEGGFKFCETLLDAQIKFLVFAHHTSVLNEYEHKVKSKKVNYVRIDGNTSEKQKHKNVETFQKDPECKIALLSITAAYQGITLHAASVVVFAEYYWTPGIIVQAEDRVHRVGQVASNVTVYYLHWEKSIDGSLSHYIGRLHLISRTEG